ncbi:MAG TPA: winged helix-turn-helix domain-containing protein [Candidatus Binataceae bacterium]|nr:winged helix-turn-helix domain-containing protein [Candidatus Binataceae bacterium]
MNKIGLFPAAGLGEKKVSEVCHFEDFELDRGAYRLSRTGEVVRLERIPMELLCLLVERRGLVVTRAEILERIWGKGVFIDSENAINTAVRKIRRALKDDADAPRFIVTIPARGYRFIAPIAVPNGDLKPIAVANGDLKAVGVQNGGFERVGVQNGELKNHEDGQQPIDANTVDFPLPAAREEKKPRWARYGLAGLLSAAGMALIASVMLAVLHFSQPGPSPSASKVSAQLQAPPLPDKPSIAVLPFTNMSGDREQEYFGDGITDDLITGLSRLPALLVIARASTFTYKGKAAKLQQVGRELRARYVLEGSVRRAAEQVRVTVQLADATTGAELWAERYDRPLRDVFALQDEIVRRIVTTLNLQIALSQQGVVIPRSTENLEAYDDLLHEAEYLLSFTADGGAKARQMLEKAIELDPRYSLAYALLGLDYYLGSALSFNRDPDALERALHLARQALALDDSLAIAHSVMAQTYMAKEQYEQALAEVQGCIRLDPNAAFGYAVLGAVLAIQGSPSEAIAAIEKAQRLNPRNAVDYLWVEGWAYTFLGRWDKAIVALKTYLGRFPDSPSPWPHAWLAVDYYSLGDRDTARTETAKAQRRNAGTPSADGYSAVAYAFNAQGKLAEGLAAAEKGMRAYPKKRGILFQRASAFTSLGRWEDSIGALKNYVALYPGDIAAHAYLASDYSALGDLDTARSEAAEVERGLMLDANFASEAPRSYDALAEVMNDTGRPMEALAAADKSNRPDRVKLAYLYQQGRAYTQLGRWQEAIFALKRYLAAHPDEVWPHVDLAVDYAKLGHDNAARAEVGEILRLNPRLSLETAVAGEFPAQRERAADLSKAGLN